MRTTVMFTSLVHKRNNVRQMPKTLNKFSNFTQKKTALPIISSAFLVHGAQTSEIVKVIRETSARAGGFSNDPVGVRAQAGWRACGRSGAQNARGHRDGAERAFVRKCLNPSPCLPLAPAPLWVFLAALALSLVPFPHLHMSARQATTMFPGAARKCRKDPTKRRVTRGRGRRASWVRASLPQPCRLPCRLLCRLPCRMPCRLPCRLPCSLRALCRLPSPSSPPSCPSARRQPFPSPFPCRLPSRPRAPSCPSAPPWPLRLPLPSQPLCPSELPSLTVFSKRPPAFFWRRRCPRRRPSPRALGRRPRCRPPWDTGPLHLGTLHVTVSRTGPERREEAMAPPDCYL